jgi:hypothetical protein
MATHSYIIERENVIVGAQCAARDGRPFDLQATRNAIWEGRHAFAYERDRGGNHANRDLWGTFGVNVHVLGRFCPDLRDECRSVAQELGVHLMDRDRY